MLYNIIQDFQHTTSDGVILTLKKGTKIDKKDNDDYIISMSKKEFRIRSIIVENNPLFFQRVDLKSRILSLLKENTKRTMPKTAEILADFMESEFSSENTVSDDILKTTLEACRLMYISTKDDKWLIPIHKLGWDVDNNGVFRG
jgi:hypothetical protein